MLKEPQKPTHLILIGGMPRSGTTLLARVAGEQLRIPFAPETHYFTYAYQNGKVTLDNLPTEVVANRRVRAAYNNIQLLPRSTKTFRILLHEILGDASVIGEKTPAHLTSFSEVLAADSHVTCIVIVRDFFETIESLRRVHWNNASFLANLKRCIRYHWKAFSTQRQFSGRLLIVDYQKLCENEKSVIAALSKWLPHGEHSDTQQIFDPRLEPWKKNALRAPEVIQRKIPLERVHLWIIAKLAVIFCKIVWPLDTVHRQ